MKKKKNICGGKKNLCLLQVCALCLAIAVIVSLALYSLGRESTTIFWFVIIVAGIVAYFILPPCRDGRCK